MGFVWLKFSCMSLLHNTVRFHGYCRRGSLVLLIQTSNTSEMSETLLDKLIEVEIVVRYT